MEINNEPGESYNDIWEAKRKLARLDSEKRISIYEYLRETLLEIEITCNQIKLDEDQFISLQNIQNYIIELRESILTAN